jgi:SagB-type dehydrogenase family enzyme
MPQLAAGLYNYQSRTHSLLRFWDSDVWGSLQEACFWHPALDRTQLAIATTAIFYRSAWRYKDRAYRRIYLDTGHLLGNIELASALNHYRPYLIGGFTDEAIDRLLYLDAQQEGTIAILPLADLTDINQHLPKGPTALPSATQTDYPEIPDGELLGYLHQATCIESEPSREAIEQSTTSDRPLEDKYNFPFCTKVSTQSAPINWGEDLEGLEKTILKRRSTRNYSGMAITLEELNALLDFTYQPQNYAAQELDSDPDYFDLNLIETFIAVSDVPGLDEGCYYYAPKARELRQVRFKNFRRQLHFLCLGQELGRDAAALVFHTADLKKAVAKYGDRAYRYLHMDAGHLGQRLNLAAIHLNLGVSGIGGFFDDQVNEVLGIPPDEAVLYVTTLGQPKSG